jgi:hypothetical protein
MLTMFSFLTFYAGVVEIFREQQIPCDRREWQC